MSKCVVSNCKNNRGVPFPKDFNDIEKWSRELKLDKASIKQGSIVCFSHFDQIRLRCGAKGKRSVNRLKKDAAPSSTRAQHETSDEDEESEEEKICRACMSDKNLETCLSDLIEDNVPIRAALMMCVHPLSIIKDDGLPKYLCKSCTNMLKIAYKLRKKCFSTDLILRTNRKRTSTSIMPKLSKRVCLKTEEKMDRQNMLEVSALDDFEIVYEDSLSRDEDECNSNTDDKNQSNVDEIEKNMEEIHGNDLNKKMKSDIVSNRTVVEGSMLQNVEDILSTLEGGNMCDKTEDLLHLNKKIVVKSNFPTAYKKDKVSSLNIKLPKGLKIKPVESYSKIGKYSSTIRYGVYDSMFVQADEYLFEIGLAKGNLRQLRCTVPTCSAQGRQQVDSNGEPSLIVEVTSSHNHPAPSEATKKKQMFLCLMRKKMQTDRTLNIRVIYEDACIQFISHSATSIFDVSSTVRDAYKLAYAPCMVVAHASGKVKEARTRVYTISLQITNNKLKLLKNDFPHCQRNTPWERERQGCLSMVMRLGNVQTLTAYSAKTLTHRCTLYAISTPVARCHSHRTSGVYGLNSIELEAKNLNISSLARPVFDHVRTQWILNVTPELFCVHKLENRINENVIAPFKKLRDFLLLTKGKMQKTHITIMHVIEKIIELEAFLRGTYGRSDKKSFGRDLSSFQKKNVLRAWQFIEDHPKIEISNFFSKVLGYIKCMENQLWIWGFYRYDGDTDDTLINATHFSIVSPNDEISEELLEPQEEYLEYIEGQENTIVMEAVIDQDGVLQTSEEITESEDIATNKETQQFESAFLKYVYQ
ncbi:hypothetical protein FQR65_LT17318 [Abscondita terminalis]|nr:hypothetical protein FQR65_LT17318 [Abscondita terminalis]